MGCEVVSAEQVWSEDCEQALAEYGKNVYWVFARRVLGPVMHFMKSNALGIDGLVYIVSFGCGPDALVKAIVDLMAKQNPDLPYMAIVLDEHSGEGGLLTRLEAFVDMTRRMRKRLALEVPPPEREEALREPERPEGVRAPEARGEYVSFPHAGTVWIPLRAVLEDLDLPVIVPPRNTRRTLDIGSRHSPELACIPFKLTLGNYVEALDMGATHLLGLSSRFGASCRLYFFPAVQEAILRDMGYDFEIVTIDSGRPDSGGEITRLVKERINKSIWEFAKAFFGTFWRKLVACEKVERLAAETRPYETRKGEASRIMRGSLARVDRCEPRLLRRLMRSVEDEFRAAVDEDRKREHEPLRIGIVGELFVLIDSFANLEIERKLGEMGVLAKRNFRVSLKILRSVWRWLDPEYAHAMNAAARYLGVDVGAECNVTVGDTVEYKKRGYDGIVHVMPFTCMPEIVAEGILPRVKGDTGMPVITFALDEQTSNAGMQTRLEAFVDLLTRQRLHAGRV
jgi:predicted nucleotide-binding protein (sugar kinase/HSP70/actin superfamily)